jgi:FMN phosphatase YigB (HAD superfamily)
MKKTHDKLIILDFDHTFFNSSEFKLELKRAFNELGINEDEFDKYYEASKKCCQLDMEMFAEKLPLADKSQVDETFNQVIETHASGLVFSDVKPFIIRYQPQYDILILTQGTQKLQQEKIDRSNLPKQIQVLITSGEKPEVIRSFVADYKKIIFIDDQVKHLDEIKKAFPQIITLLIQRFEDDLSGDETKHDSADDIIKNLNIDLKKY